MFVDILFAMNIIMDYMILTLTALVMKEQPSIKRKLGGALLASLYLWVMLVPEIGFLLMPVVKILYSLLIIRATFGKRRIIRLLQLTGTFYFVQFAIGGGMLAVHYFLTVDQSFATALKNPGFSPYGSPLSWGFIVISFPGLWLFVKHRDFLLRAIKRMEEKIVPVILASKEATVRLKGFIDTGNQAMDPLTKRPIIFVNEDKLQEVLAEEQIQKLITNNMDNLSIDMTVVPIRTVAGQALRVVWKPSSCNLERNGQKESCHVYVALSETLSDTDRYNCLLHESMEG
ncbi:sigma-E processing peptidase SpoIIGA [Paenalkalicoccus suaedae]|uniref:Sporulation sigma-E factor-processing peptidase n=1 Tax=Paenalkalicoccus suaedae TaxID=2592382 RepID=A0A859FH24_9BACI|nr:sigma-E processing peptidase SpoIIGA [Paenalkalicoccus suaedae]QKS71515.1 sigma-E processing peptidase SpoIIGA [Paenalkalicoccus suaedae]